MQKIKLSVFKTWFDKNLTGNEIDFLIALSHLQNTHGVIQGVHYKEICEKANMSVQAFYDCKKSLQEKEVITVTRVKGDYDITIIGNDFAEYTDADYKAGKVKYINTNQQIFSDKNWSKLKPAQKLLSMDLLNINTASNFRTYRINRRKFINKYANGINPDGTERKGLLNVTERTLQKYLKMLQLFFYVGIKDGMYLITLRSTFSKKVVQSESDVTYKHMIKAACRRNNIKESDPAEEKDILKVLDMYRKYINNAFIQLDITKLFERMLEVINVAVMNPRKWKRRLKASLFHKLLKEELQMA